MFRVVGAFTLANKPLNVASMAGAGLSSLQHLHIFHYSVSSGEAGEAISFLVGSAALALRLGESFPALKPSFPIVIWNESTMRCTLHVHHLLHF